jgi:acetyl-CoA synthetase
VTVPARPGALALITQSGNLGVLALAHRAGLDLHTVISLGNAAVLDAPAVLSHLARTAPGTGLRAVALYLEDDGDGARLAAALAECAGADLRVAVLKAGRSAAGRRAGGAHTAALAGDHRVFAALVEEAGGVLAGDLHALIETARALAAARRDPRPAVVVTASGGDAAIAADLAADVGLPLAEPAPATVARIRAVLGAGAAVTNPLDHTNALWADAAAIASVTAALAGDPAAGPVVYVQDEPPGLPPVDAAEWAATRAGARRGAGEAGANLLLVATTPGQEPVDPDADLAPVAGLRPALAALAALRRPAPDPARLRAIAAAARSAPGPDHGDPGGGPWLAEHEAKALLRAAGISTPAHAVLPLDSAVIKEFSRVAAAQLGFPLALKVSAPGLVHKSEAGLLSLGVAGEHELRAAAKRLKHAAAGIPGAVLLIERMAPPGVELVLAVRRDGVVPVLVVGAGGIWAEALDDVTLVPLPADPTRVVAALRSLRAAPVLTGGRARPGLDLAAVGEIGCRMGLLAIAENLALLEVNPLIVARAGAVAVDALARR